MNVFAQLSKLLIVSFDRQRQIMTIMLQIILDSMGNSWFNTMDLWLSMTKLSCLHALNTRRNQVTLHEDMCLKGILNFRLQWLDLWSQNYFTIQSCNKWPSHEIRVPSLTKQKVCDRQTDWQRSEKFCVSSWNVFDDICRICRGPLWSWFVIINPLFTKICTKNNDPDLWSFVLRFTLPGTCIQVMSLTVN